MSTYQILCLLGIPSLVGALGGWIFSNFKRVNSDMDATKLGIQALLRAQMISDYNKWSAKGYAPIYARDNFENVWKQYHALGANGVMDDIHDKFMALPIEKAG